jgi:hypothetical protein
VLFLLKKHRTSLYIQEKDGVTPFEMCSGLGQRMGAWRIAQLVMEVAAETGREAKKKKKVTERTCAKCNTSLQKSPLVCSLCIMVSYCGKDCQIAHWREGHKAECSFLRTLSEGVKIDPPSGERNQRIGFMQSYQTGNSFTGGKYMRPNGVKCNEQFTVKTKLRLVVTTLHYFCMIKPVHASLKYILLIQVMRRFWTPFVTSLPTKVEKLL